MVKFIEKYTKINNVLGVIALSAILPINIVIALLLAFYFVITESLSDKKNKIILKTIIIVGYIIGLVTLGQNMLLITKVMHFSLFIAMVTNLILSSISKEENLIVFVNIFFIGFLSKFNPIFLSALFLVLFFKKKLDKFLLFIIAVIGCFLIVTSIYLKDKNEWTMANLIDGLLIVYYENTGKMDVSYNGYYNNPDGYILMQSDEMNLQPYLSVNRFVRFDAQNNEWIDSPVLGGEIMNGKLFSSFICKCAIDKKSDWKFSSLTGFTGKRVVGQESVYYVPQAIKLPNYHMDTSLIIDELIRDLQKNHFSYNKNISKFISNKNDVEFFKAYKVGLCRHFASYAALYLQNKGVPAHVVVGYFNPVNKDVPAGKYTLEGAHAWVEYFDGKTQRWNIFDGTSMVPLSEANIQWDVNKRIILEEYSITLVVIVFLLIISFCIYMLSRVFIKYKIPKNVHPYFYLDSESFKQWELWYEKYPYWITQCLVVWSSIKKRP